MCIGIPMRVVRSTEGTALCERRGERTMLDTMLIGALEPGAYVLAFQGRAVRAMSAVEAAQTDAALDALEAALDGASDVSHLFADLVDREPALPPHLVKDR